MKIVKIEWLDSRGVNDRWEFASNLDRTPCRVMSVGYLIDEDEESITVAPHVGMENDGDNQVCGAMVIPKCAITHRFEMMRLEEVDD